MALIGGATARIGDPSGKSLERPQLDVKTLKKNTVGIQGNINTILGRWDKNRNLSLNSNLVSEQSPVCSYGFGQSFELLNNFDWWKDVSFHQFLEKVGRFARVSTMIAKESVKKRLEAKQGISYTEFAYQLLQGYDFLYCIENEGVNVQIGGSDQWGNITARTELIRKSLRVEGAYGLTFPLLLKSDGTKFGKSEDGAIWLSPSMLLPYKFYQYFLTIPDVDVVRFLTILTFLSMEEIRELEKGMRSPGYVPNSLQKRLAEEVTRFVHGEVGLMEALRATEASTFGAKMSFDGMAIVGIRIAEGVPSCSLANEQLLDACLDLSVSTGLPKSKLKSCRLIKQRGLYLNNEGVENKENKIEASSNVFNILEERGLLDLTTTENLRSACSYPNLSPLKVYCGFVPTAESLHLGNLLGLILLSWFQCCGHKVVALIGRATVRIGDPSGKSSERPELDIEALEKNTEGIVGNINTILGRWNKKRSLSLNSNMVLNKTLFLVLAGEGFVVLNNKDWWKNVRLLDFLKRVGRFARVDTMLANESVKKRMEAKEGMSFTEFTYQLLQGYDFLHLFENEGVNVQIGGGDQWGNITAGTELIRKILQVEGAYGLTFPLLLTSDGTKFGKSEDGATWLSPSMSSPYKFYQHLFSMPDADVVTLLKKFTFLSMEEIRELEERMRRPGYVPNSLQKRLAEEVTRLVHGEDGLKETLRATEALKPGAETSLDWKAIEGIAEDLPSCSLAYDRVLDALVIDLSVSTGLLESKSAAHRLMKQGGFI